jgi:hypothetical protein
MGKQKPTLGTNPNLDERFGDYALLENSAKAAHDEGHNRAHYRSLVRAVRCFGLNWPVSYAWTLNISRYTRITEIVGAASERPKYVIETKGTGPVISLGGWTEVG